MLITKYGVDNFLIIIITSIILFVLGYFINSLYAKYPLILLSIILFVFAFVFFRDPERQVPLVAQNDDSYVISPADGKVVEIIEEEEKYYIKNKAIRLSIFLSPVDVHVNRSPVSGLVEFYNYYPGEYLVAYHPKSSELNEHSKIGVMTSKGKVLFKQIVGVLARRIVCVVKEGDILKSGDKIGMMKFGSRMDVYLPLETNFKVKVGDRVVAGETILAIMK